MGAMMEVRFEQTCRVIALSSLTTIVLFASLASAEQKPSPIPTNPGQITTTFPATPTYTYPVASSNPPVKEAPSQNQNQNASDNLGENRRNAGARPKCSDGTYWYEPAKACVPGGDHPAERQAERQVCPPKCGPSPAAPVVIPSIGLGEKGEKPRPFPPKNCTHPPCPGEQQPQNAKGTIVCCCGGKPYDQSKYKCSGDKVIDSNGNIITNPTK